MSEPQEHNSRFSVFACNFKMTNIEKVLLEVLPTPLPSAIFGTVGNIRLRKLWGSGGRARK